MIAVVGVGGRIFLLYILLIGGIITLIRGLLVPARVD